MNSNAAGGDKIRTLRAVTAPAQLTRTRLLDDYLAILPRLVVIAAPAGYGKSTVARQIASCFEQTAICDCAAVDSERQLWYEVLAAIGKAHRTSGLEAIAARAGVSGDPSLANVLALLGDLGRPILLTFENAERAFADPGLRRALQRLVGASPRSCTTVLCSRTGARLKLSKFAAPHEMLVWRVRDLAFDRAEIGAIFAPRQIDAQLINAIHEATSGWPVAVLFLQRFVDRSGLECALRRFDKVDFEQLHEYLVDEVLAELSSAEFDAVLACSIVPEPTIEDVERLIPNASNILAGLVEACPLFARIDAERFEVHPLLDAAIMSRFADERRKLGLILGEALERDRQFVRAAQVYRAIRAADAMARALIAENTNPQRTRTIAYSALLATLDDRLVEKYPVLNALTIYWRRFRVDPHALVAQTELVWKAMGGTESLELRANVGSTIARMMYETGAFTKAHALLSTLESEFGGIPELPTTAGQAYVARTLGCIAARSGKLEEADRYFRSGYLARPGAENVRSRYFIERAVIERLNGRSQDEERLFELALESALAAQAPVQAVCALAEAAFGAWFHGEDVRFNELLARLDLEAHANNYVAFTHFCGVGSGRLEVSANGTEQPNWLACTLLIAAAASAGNERAAHARAALAAADASHDIFLQLLACLALAASDASRSAVMTAQALQHAHHIESPVLQQAVAAVAEQRDGESMLGSFIGRFRATPVTVPLKPLLRVEVLARRVFRGEQPVDVGERQVALLMALARERRAYPRATLTQELWPDLTEAAAREALNSCVYRVRSRLGSETIVFEHEAYRLGEDVRVDLRDLEAASSRTQRVQTLSREERDLLERAAVRFNVPTTDVPETLDFLVPTLMRAAQMIQTIAERLALDALRVGAPERALTIARELIAGDPCDEQARDIAIRALLQQGDRSSALLELRTYQKVLWRELEVHPSAALTALFQEDALSHPAGSYAR